MIQIHVNGEPRRLDSGTTVAGVVDTLDVERGRRGLAVAIDAEVVPRREWERRELREGEHVEVLTAIQGG